MAEIIIACHNPQRRIDRAVDSILDDNRANVTVTVVCHNVSPESIKARLSNRNREKVRLLHLQDGIYSPAGPFNLGLERAKSSWVGVMGSDDYLQPGAVRRWLALTPGADAVVTHLRRADGSTVPTPPVRPLPRRRRAVIQDRLFYRSAPLGLIRTDFLRDHQLSFSPGFPTGEDLEFSARLWVQGRIRVQRRGPGYVIGQDADDRVSLSSASAKEEFAHLAPLWNGPWVASLDPAIRSALGTKYLRIHIFGAAYSRSISQQWNRQEQVALAAASALILRRAPTAADPLSVADRLLLDALLDTSTSLARLAKLALARRHFGSPSTLIPTETPRLFEREGPFRFMTASALAMVVGRI